MSLKIDLEEIASDRRYTEVAFLVDNDNFLNEIMKVRELTGLETPLEYDEAKSWLHVQFKETSLLKMKKEDRNHAKKRFKLANNVGMIKEKFKKGVNFTNIITYAILANKVTDREFAPSAFCEIYPFSEEFESAELNIEEPMVAIFVNPETKLEEVEKLIKTEVRELFEKASKSDTTPPRERTNIRRDRKWYWKNHSSNPNRLGYGKIANKHKGISLSAVKEAIKQYRKDLAMQF